MKRAIMLCVSFCFIAFSSCVSISPLQGQGVALSMKMYLSAEESGIDIGVMDMPVNPNATLKIKLFASPIITDGQFDSVTIDYAKKLLTIRLNSQGRLALAEAVRKFTGKEFLMFLVSYMIGRIRFDAPVEIDVLSINFINM